MAHEAWRLRGEEVPGPNARPALPRRPGVLLIDGASFEAEVCGDDTLWAARAHLPTDKPHPDHLHTVVTVNASGVGEGEVRLTWVDDLRPLALEKRRMELEERAAHLAAKAAAKAALPSDLDAHRALIETMLERERRASKAKGRTPDALAEDARSHALWEAAVERQARLRGQSAGLAQGAVLSMVDHMRKLAGAASWFTDDPVLREAAIEETVAHTARAQAVRSQPAQHAWQVLRAGPATRFDQQAGELRRALEEGILRRRPEAAAELLDRGRREQDLGEAERDRWLRAWEIWSLERRFEG